MSAAAGAGSAPEASAASLAEDGQHPAPPPRPGPATDRTGDGPMLGPGTVTWRVNREPVVFMGGGRALLLQVAHPLVAAGVAQHSNYQADPWGRLYRTLDTTVKIVFGPREVSARAGAKLRRRHDYVSGHSDDGVPYHAQDPALLLWVWATLVDTALLLYERCLGPLPRAERERFVAEQALFAHACGVPEDRCPTSLSEFEDYFARMVATELRVTPAARAVADSLAPSAAPLPLRPAFALHWLVTAGLLPTRTREGYGLPWSRRRQRLLDVWLRGVGLGVRPVPLEARALPVTLTAAGRLDRLRIPERLAARA